MYHASQLGGLPYVLPDTFLYAPKAIALPVFRERFMKISTPCRPPDSVLFALTVSLLGMGCGVASAADLSAKAYKAPPLVAQAYDWTGFYIGGFGGYATENTDGDPKMKGGSAGGTIGYNWQTSNVVLPMAAGPISMPRHRHSGSP
jgi:hypothetical protein